MNLRCSLVPKLPVVSGKQLLKALNKIGYEVVRQRGSHVRLTKKQREREHHITIPMHKEIKRGTLNDILSKVTMWNQISREELIEVIKNA